MRAWAKAGRAWIAAHQAATLGWRCAVISSGAISSSIRFAKGTCAMDAVNPAQTIRPDMTHRLAADLLKKHQYILATTTFGKIFGRYQLTTER